jgi:hypothetical protein
MQKSTHPGIAFAQLKMTSCRWALGGPWERAERFCGEPVVPGRSWCAEHHTRAYNKLAPSARQREIKNALWLAR